MASAAVGDSTTPVDKSQHSADDELDWIHLLRMSNEPRTSTSSPVLPMRPSAAATASSEAVVRSIVGEARKQQVESTSSAASSRTAVTGGGHHFTRLRSVSARVRAYLVDHIQPIRSFLYLMLRHLRNEHDTHRAVNSSVLADYQAQLADIPNPPLTPADVSESGMLMRLIGVVNDLVVRTEARCQREPQPYLRDAALVYRCLDQADGDDGGQISNGDGECPPFQLLFTMQCISEFERTMLVKDDYVYPLVPGLIDAYRRMRSVLEGAMRMHVGEIQSPPAAEEIIFALFHARAYHLAMELVRRFDLTLNDDCHSLLRWSVGPSSVLDRSSLLSFLPFGLDPTWIDPTEADAKSTLELAREYARHHTTNDAATLVTSAAASISVDVSDANEADQLQPEAYHLSLVAAFATPASLADRDAEMQRRKDLQPAFIRNLLVVWRRHSRAVRQRLLDASPSKLIPPLVDIVAEYLDLDSTHLASDR
jgi:hypothetical protein